MKHLYQIASLLIFFLACTSVSSLAQPYVLASYRQCDEAKMNQADALIENILGPVIDKHVAAGDIDAWGYWVHRAGGNWSRLTALVSDNIDDLLNGQEATIASLSEGSTALATREFLEICPTHEDYIWSVDASSAQISDLVKIEGPANYSIYYQCDLGEAERISELVELFTPEMNAFVEEGLFDSWMWGSHIIGSDYNYVGSWRGSSHGELVSAIGQISQRMSKKFPKEFREFFKICSSNSDYLWDVKIMR